MENRVPDPFGPIKPECVGGEPGQLQFFFLRFYLFLFEEGKGGRETSVCGCLSCTPPWGPGPQPRHVP